MQSSAPVASAKARRIAARSKSVTKRGPSAPSAISSPKSLRHGVEASRAVSSSGVASGHSYSGRACSPAPPSASAGPLTVCSQRLP
jgi:hypothetical protein